jgi:hypothetical protein
MAACDFLVAGGFFRADPGLWLGTSFPSPYPSSPPIMAVLGYRSPQEVLVNRATVLSGTYDPQQLSDVALVAEDKYPLDVDLYPDEGTWQVKLENGLTSPGVRWLRLSGKNSAGDTAIDRLVYVTVSRQPLTDVDSATLKVRQDTFFKASPGDSGQLDDANKVRVEAGQTYTVRRYGIDGVHLKVEFDTAVSPVGKFGYLYRPHVELSRGDRVFCFDEEDLPDTKPGTELLWITQTTKLKAKPEDSSHLSDRQFLDLPHGETFSILGHTCVNGHFKVSFDRPPDNFGNSGYLYHPHVRIRENGTWAEFDPDALTVTVLKTTPFKKQPIASSNLPESDKYTAPVGAIYGVASYELEKSHLKVSLTENLPGFGNTGYFYADFVQLKQGDKPFEPTPVLVYTGPSEVLAGQAVTLDGTFDPQQIASVSLVAEDKYSLPVSLNRSRGTWQVRLDNGFQDAGARWLRLKGTNRQGSAISSQIIYISVLTDSLTVGQSLRLKVLRETYFKAAPVDSSRLDFRQKVEIPAGQTYKVNKYGYLDGHLKVMLEGEISPVGDFGYFFEPHVELNKGDRALSFEIEDVPDQSVSGQMLVTQTTYLKIQPVDSSSLPNSQKAELLLGETFGITGYASTAGHFRITLTESVPGFGNVGYVYWQHVQLKKGNEIIPYNPEALTATVLQATVLKRKPVSASRLSAGDKASLPVGRVYGVSSYTLEDGHIRAALTEELPGYGNTGYLFPAHVQMRRGGETFNPFPSQIELNVPYFSQRDNPRFYWSTCNVTSIAMVFYYYGVRPVGRWPLEDDLLEWVINRYGEGAQTDHAVLSALIRDYGFDHSFSTTRYWSEVETELVNRHPVVLAGDFTATGHIVTVIGYTPSGLIVHDPWGDALTGYANTEGRRLLYPNGYINRVCGPEGNIWAHFIRKR